MEQAVPGATAAAGPGQRLCHAREAAGLSREEVATRLRLRLDLIRALEEDDYQSLPPLAFVGGYLRSYARLLGLPAEELVALLEQRREAPPLVSPGRPPQQRHSGDWPVKLVTYLIVLLLIGLLAAWWFGRQPLEQDAEMAVAPMVTPGDPVQLSLPAVDETEETGEVEEVLPPAEDAAAAETTAPVMALAEILLELARGDCWISIKDASGTQLVYELLKEGTTRTVRGTAPFDVFLGNAPAVTVYYQGQVFDHTPYQRREVARFRLGKAADNKPVTE